ncbi:protein SON isoform X1 [Osmerus eperlanus]|uniref:protein SON isoform X1 n=1 Tax=Osmerus eperlanus TaxID=29151 RepID=UPI002E0F11E5
MAAIEQIFRDFVVNKIKEIEESQDTSPTDDPQSNGKVTTEGATGTIPQDKEEASVVSNKEEGDVLHKKHKKHKKHKSKKKKKRRKEDRDSSSESAVDSDGATQHDDSNGREQQSDKPKDPQTGEDDEKSKRRKRHSSKKKKKKKKQRRKDEDKTGSSTESEAEPGAREPERRDGKDPSANGRSQDLPDIVPKETGRDSRRRSRSGSRPARRRPRSDSKSGHRSRRSRSRSRSRSRHRSRSRSARRSRRTRSRSVVVLRRDRKSKSPYRSRSRTRRRRTKSRSTSPSRRHHSTSRETSSKPKEGPLAEKDTSVVKEVVSECEPADEPKNLPVLAEPSALPDASSSQEEATNSGAWKPVPLLEVKGEAALSTPQASEPPGSPPKCPVPPEVPLAPSSSDPQPLHETAEPGASEGPSDALPQAPSKEAASSAGETGGSRSGSPQSNHQQAPGDGDKLGSKAEDKPAAKKSRRRKSKSRTPSHRKRASRSRSRGRTKRSRSRSPKRKQSRSRSPGRRSRRTRSRSGSRRRRGTFAGNTLSQRDRWKREPSHSPVLILRKKRSPARTHRSASKSPSRLTELDKDQLLEIAKANAAAMCAKAGMPIPDSLRPKALVQLPLNLPLNLPAMAMNAAMASMTAATMTAALSSMGALSSMPQMAPLPSITNKPPPGPPQPNMAAIEEAKRKVSKQANIISIKEFTDKCKKIVESKGELAVAQPHHSDEEEEGKPFGGAALREVKGISFSINNASVRPAVGVRSDAAYAKEFPVSSGSQHRKKEGEGAYGEWVPVEKKGVEKAKALAAVKAAAVVAKAASSGEAASGVPLVVKPVLDSDSVFPEPPLQPVDITQAVSERIKAQRRLAENPYDVNAMCMLTRAQEQVDAWAQSNTIPGLFTGSTGAQVLSSEELSNSGPQAWIKKDQFLRAAPVSGGVGEFLMRKMGWRTGEGLGRNREGTVEPIVIDFKIDRKGLVAEGEKPQKSGGLVVTKDMLGKHPVSALMELCNKKRWTPPEFVMVHHSGPDHRKNFLFKVVVNGGDYQPQSASPNKKHAKAMAATVALQALGEVPVDGPGLYTGPVFTAATTGPLFSSSSSV